MLIHACQSYFIIWMIRNINIFFYQKDTGNLYEMIFSYFSGSIQAIKTLPDIIIFGFVNNCHVSSLRNIFCIQNLRVISSELKTIFTKKA